MKITYPSSILNSNTDCDNLINKLENQIKRQPTIEYLYDRLSWINCNCYCSFLSAKEEFESPHLINRHSGFIYEPPLKKDIEAYEKHLLEEGGYENN